MRISGSKEQEIEAGLVEAIKRPQVVNLPSLGKAVLSMVPKPSYFYAHTVSGFQFTVKNVSFRVTFTGHSRPRLILECRHMEAVRWQNGKFDNRKRKKVKELVARVTTISSRPPSPFS